MKMEALTLPNNGAPEGNHDDNARRRDLIDLPVEILEQICSCLCLHCRVDCVPEIPQAAMEKAFEDQTALARLSQTCKHLRDIVQPTLFHWFSGLDRHIRDLAKSVHAMVLYAPLYEHKLPINH